ncbi:dihydrofolate reductase family protein [Streptomyces sp. NPDC059262]|uniref:dihydrofolate reductase family protein n=1 Tax=Streptomyces sp. NPDC059262 TaxID=3346797 RepID=UPI0036CB9CA9
MLRRTAVPRRSAWKAWAVPSDADDFPGWDRSTLIEAGLVDEYRLFVYPVVQGRGRRLFPDGYEVPRLRLVDAKPFESGIVLLRYVPA